MDQASLFYLKALRIKLEAPREMLEEMLNAENFADLSTNTAMKLRFMTLMNEIDKTAVVVNEVVGKADEERLEEQAQEEAILEKQMGHTCEGYIDPKRLEQYIIKLNNEKRKEQLEKEAKEAKEREETEAETND